ncbi:hypothetical protein ACIA6E_16320 [Streptomyces sp. NPDC051815]|uniref:hypothetical protein n=1 Tax=Streptomyces sp. NPDC051815 TaxID=3365674 RepID=UPI003793AA2F
MHRPKPSRARLLVPSALAAVILAGAAAPAVAADADRTAPAARVASVQQQIEKIEQRAAAAGPIDDLLAGLNKTLADLLASLGDLLPDGVTLPPIQLPELPELPEIPGLPELPEIPELPPLPELPELPEIPGVPPLPELPEIPEVPEVPEIPDVPVP